MSEYEINNTNPVNGRSDTTVASFRDSVNKFVEAVVDLMPKSEWDDINREMGNGPPQPGQPDLRLSSRIFLARGEIGRNVNKKALAETIYKATSSGVFQRHLDKFIKRKRNDVLDILKKHGDILEADGVIASYTKTPNVETMRKNYREMMGENAA